MKKIFLSLLAIAATGTLMAGVTPHFDLEVGYDHGQLHLRTNDMGYSYFSTNAQMDGFHFGGNVQLDFLDGQHKPGLVLGLNYQFLANNVANKNAKVKANIEQFKQECKSVGATNVVASDYAYMHTIQIPIRAQYTYQVDNNWRIFVQTGPQVRLHVGFQEVQQATCKIDGKKTGSYGSQDVVSGNEVLKTWLNGTLIVDEKSQIDQSERMDCFDMSWGFLFGFGWKCLSLNISYDYGMINLFNNAATREAKKVGQYYRLNSDALAVTLGFRLK